MISILKLNDFIWILSSGFLPRPSWFSIFVWWEYPSISKGCIEKDSVDVSFNKKERDYDFVCVYIFDKVIQNKNNDVEKLESFKNKRGLINRKNDDKLVYIPLDSESSNWKN